MKDKSNPYDYRYDKYETRETQTKSYSRTFLLAYDESSEFELKCLSGGKAVDKAAEQACNTQDLDLLERLLLLGDNKNQCYLSAEKYAKVLSAVEAIVERDGWTVLVERVAKHFFDTMLDYSDALYRINWTADLAQLFHKLKAISEAAPLMEDYLQKLASAYVRLKKNEIDIKNSKVSLSVSYPQVPLDKVDPISNDRFMDLMRLILQHGNSDDWYDFGLWISRESERIPKLLDKLPESNIDLALELFNKCMIQCDCIDQMLEKFPEIPQAVSSDGRIPLHYATGTDHASFDTIELLLEAYPNGASTIDPETGLYPFMLASVSGIVDATFKLLVADPSLVGGALDSEGKKRKRSPSMD